MTDDSLDDLYFDWLRAKVLAPRDHNYEDLLMMLFKTEFVWVIFNDQNRAADGIELRFDFLRETNYQRDVNWVEEPCSIFEMLLGFAQRAAFQTDTPVRDWFWKMIENLRLDDYRQMSDEDHDNARRRLHTFMQRLYPRTGDGGLFPMQSPKDDQRKVEIWYQFCAYVDAESLI